MSTTQSTRKDSPLRTAREVAITLGVHKSTVNRIAADQDIGVFVGFLRIFSPADIRKIKKICKFERGNPNFRKINQAKLA
jgi:hypothetical protein